MNVAMWKILTSIFSTVLILLSMECDVEQFRDGHEIFGETDCLYLYPCRRKL